MASIYVCIYFSYLRTTYVHLCRNMHIHIFLIGMRNTNEEFGNYELRTIYFLHIVLNREISHHDFVT